MPKANKPDIEALKAKALDNAPSALTLIDLQGKRLWANKAFVKFTGKPVEELLGVPVELAYPIEEQGRIRQAILEETVQKGGISDFETWFERDGKRVWVKIGTSLIRDESGNPSAIIYSADDISHIKQAHEEKEGTMRSLYESIVELSPDAIVMATQDGRIRTANRATLEMLGPADRVSDWIDLEDQGKHKGWIEDIVKKGRGSCPGHEVALRARNGRMHNAILHHGLSRFLEDNSPCVIFYIKDITEIKAIKEKAELLLNLSPLGICEWRPGGELLEVNDQYAGLVGYTKEEVFKMGWKNLTAPEYQEDPDRVHEENALKGTDKTYRKEYIHKDGHRVPIYLVTEPIFKQDGTPDYYISFIQDLTPIVERERLIDTILETIPAGLVIGDSSGRLYLVNRGYAQLAGKKKEELLEQGWVNLTAQEDAKRTKEVLERIEDGTLDEEVIEKTYVREDGTKRITQNTYRPIEHKGRYIAVCCTMDITLLKEAHEKLEEYIKEQKRTIEVVEEQKRIILELSTPILPVWRGILLAPLIGNFDSMRMQRLFENLLQATAEQKPRAVLLDLSGVAFVDTQVISEIVRLIDALRLLGTITLLVGIQPRVAQGLVRLGVDLKGTPSHATLAQGLKAVLGTALH